LIPQRILDPLQRGGDGLQPRSESVHGRHGSCARLASGDLSQQAGLENAAQPRIRFQLLDKGYRDQAVPVPRNVAQVRGVDAPAVFQQVLDLRRRRKPGNPAAKILLQVPAERFAQAAHTLCRRDLRVQQKQLDVGKRRGERVPNVPQIAADAFGDPRQRFALTRMEQRPRGRADFRPQFRLADELAGRNQVRFPRGPFQVVVQRRIGGPEPAKITQ
jgi:hypothetical protein